MEEIWKDIKGYEGLYQVSNLGRVRSFPRNGTRSNNVEFMTQTKDEKGYLRTWLSKNRKGRNFKIHRLVAEAFIPNDSNLPQVNHKDENKQNNHADNLEWCDCRYNNCYNDRMDKISKKISKKVKCLETNVVYKSVAKASRQTGLPHSSIIYVCQGKYKQIKGYHFKYEDF